MNHLSHSAKDVFFIHLYKIILYVFYTFVKIYVCNISMNYNSKIIRNQYEQWAMAIIEIKNTMYYDSWELLFIATINYEG